MLINYIRNKKRQPHGVVVALNKGGEILIGYSLCSPHDQWNREKGLKIAKARAEADVAYQLPSEKHTITLVKNAMDAIEKRALKYFKNGQ